MKLYTYLFDPENKSVYLIMEYCPYGNLKELIETNKSMKNVDIPYIFSRILRGIIDL